MYVDVLLPLYLDRLLTYSVPPELRERIVIGGRVSVNIGKSKIYTGIVIAVHGLRDGEDPRRIKPVSEVADSVPVVTPRQIELWRWMADYYLCTPGEIMKQFLPASLRPQGTLGGADTPKYEASRSLVRQKQLFIPAGADTEAAQESLKRAKMQLEAYRCILANSEPAEGGRTIPRGLLTAGGFSPAVLRALIGKGLVGEREIRVFRPLEDQETAPGEDRLHPLTAPQQTASDEIGTCFASGRPALLFGVPGSGKTEIYLHRAAEALATGRSALILLPEIALTDRIADRIAGCFPGRTLLYHSRQTDKKRFETYRRILAGENLLVVGTRLAVALPFRDLGLVVIDEENDAGYKQQEKRPFFQARDTAVLLGRLHGAHVLLASSAPSIESYHNCETGKYGLVRLRETYRPTTPPRVSIIDRRHIALKDKQVYGYRYDTRYFSKLMLARMQHHLENGGQTLILHNRRGFAAYTECENCGHVPQCPACNVTLTYHKQSRTLECHYCGFRETVFSRCPECGGTMALHGIGAENVEESIERYFPNVPVARIDGDVLKRFGQFRKTLEEAVQGKAGIVVGTQLIAKGFSFPHATLACVVNVDTLLNFPDFRAEERVFQLITQFAGRTASAKEGRELIIQTAQPERELFRDLVRFDYENLYRRELAAREKFGYPPFTRLVRITLRHEEQEFLLRAAGRIAEELEKEFGGIVQGPEIPLVDRIRGLYLANILLKIPRNRPAAPLKRACRDTLLRLNASLFRSRLRIDLNADV